MRSLEESLSTEPTAQDDAEDRALGTDDEITREFAALEHEPGPRTVQEWRALFAQLEGEVLREVGLAANGARFVRRLREDGLAPKDVHAVLAALARRFADTGQRGPDGGLYDWDELAGYQVGP